MVTAARAEAPQPALLRQPKVAGTFYPDDPKELRELIQQLLNRQPEPSAKAKIRALIVPHAGYQYSGLIAANAYRQIQGHAYDGVVVVGFTHQTQFSGSSVDDREALVTPLGEIPVHQEAAAILRTYPGVAHVEAAHESDEHSLEVQLPFLQVAVKRLRVVPVLMGNSRLQDAQQLAQALAGLSRFGNFLYVFSTDLSHYHAYDQANAIDEQTITAILEESPQAVSRLFEAGKLEACGRGPIVASLFLAGKLGYLSRELLYHANSGDTWGPPTRVVGYAAIAMHQSPAHPSAKQLPAGVGAVMLRAARAALEGHFAGEQRKLFSQQERTQLARQQGLFVTLRKNSQLRGCIGRIQSDQALADSLPQVALDAALHDPRFSPVSAQELPGLHVEVSVLTPPVKVSSPEEIVPGRDGVILRTGSRSGVFLPQVWDETGWTRVEFLSELASQKAGLSPEAWRTADLYTFQAQIFEE